MYIRTVIIEATPTIDQRDILKLSMPYADNGGTSLKDLTPISFALPQRTGIASPF